MNRQNYKCAICLTENPGGKGKFYIDHCHTTGKNRGLLCSCCNILLGQAKESKETLMNAIKYLEDTCSIANS